MIHGENGQAYNISVDSCNVHLRDFASACANWAGKEVVFQLPSDTEKNSITETTKNTSAIETDNQVEQNTEINRDAESDPINTNPADTPTTKPVELDNSNENSNSNSATPTPEPTATPTRPCGNGW